MDIFDTLKEQALVKFLEKSMHKGWDNFYLVYQPIVSLNDSAISIVGAESLARCNDQMLGKNITPDRFIPVIENNPELCQSFGEFVMNKVAQDAQEYNFSFPISINISPSQLNDIGRFDKLLQKYKKDFLDKKFKLEITEGKVLRVEGVEYLNQIHLDGYTIWCDDLGTGQNTLSGLVDKEFYSGIKIDKSFVKKADFSKGNRSSIITKGMIDICLKLDIDIIVEGIETRDQAEYLGKIPRVTLQGNYFSKPVSGKEIVSLYKLND